MVKIPAETRKSQICNIFIYTKMNLKKSNIYNMKNIELYRILETFIVFYRSLYYMKRHDESLRNITIPNGLEQNKKRRERAAWAFTRTRRRKKP